jgi:hypothetical protein
VRNYATMARTFREATLRCADPSRRLALHWAAYQIEAQLRGLKPTWRSPEDCPAFMVEHAGLCLLAETPGAEGDAVAWELVGGGSRDGR